MPTYVFSPTFTQQGVEIVRESPKRTEHAKELVESLGGTWKEFFATIGRYPGLVIADFFDDSTATTAVLALATSGNVTTETLRASPLDEFHDILDVIPRTSIINDR